MSVHRIEFVPPRPDFPTDQPLHAGIAQMLSRPSIAKSLDPAHLAGTPTRVCKMYREIFWGCDVEPSSALNTAFPARSDEMVSLYDMEFVSHCAHHLLPFYGKAHFAYIPNGEIVGLSKIPRLIDILAARPQVQENLCEQIADVFAETLKPRGVAVCLDAVHTCMFTRGAKKLSITRTTALRGLFLTESHAKAEFLAGIRRIQK